MGDRWRLIGCHVNAIDNQIDRPSDTVCMYILLSNRGLLSLTSDTLTTSLVEPILGGDPPSLASTSSSYLQYIEDIIISSTISLYYCTATNSGTVSESSVSLTVMIPSLPSIENAPVIMNSTKYIK